MMTMMIQQVMTMVIQQMTRTKRATLTQRYMMTMVSMSLFLYHQWLLTGFIGEGEHVSGATCDKRPTRNNGKT